MKKCVRLQSLPSSICELKLLQKFVLSGCSKLNKLPPLYGLYSLEELYLDGSRLKEIPSDIVSLTSLRVLNLNNCDKLHGLPELPCRLMEIQAVNCRNLSKNARCKIVEDVHQRIEEMAFATALSYRRAINISKWDIVIGLPGGEIPEWDTVVCLCRNEVPEWDSLGFPSRIPKWFSYQGQGSSFSILFTPNWFDVLGFTFCAV
ncbi:disease resistance protein RPS4B-like, partial [Jatropha curcas]|uniref:disease resistance protein RPS4B-like n=1 Tax=Jatropha curcas TaxID=180498 RepID=UPI00189471E9